MADAEFNLDVQTPSAAISEIAKGEQWPGTPSGGSSTQPSKLVHRSPRDRTNGAGRSPFTRRKPSWWRPASVPSPTGTSVRLRRGPDRTRIDQDQDRVTAGPCRRQVGRLLRSPLCPYRPRGTPPLLRRCCVAHMALGHSGFQYQLGCKRGSDPVSPAHDRRAAGARRRSSARVQLRAPSR